MGKYRGLDTDTGWINRKFADLERQVREMAAARRLPGSTVDQGDSLGILGSLRIMGSLIVSGALDLTGTMSMKSDAGRELLRMGDMPLGDRGMELKRDDGSTAMWLRVEIADQPQTLTLLDKNNDRLLEEQPFLGGMRRPYFEHPFQPVAAASGTAVVCGPFGFERSTSSGSWETLFVHDGKRQNPFVDLKVAAMCSDGTTAGEIRVVNLATGLPLPDFFGGDWLGEVAAGTVTMTVVDPAPHENGTYGVAYGGYMRIGVQARRTAGAGSVTVSIPQSIGG